MATSQNGYPANDRSLIARYTVPGTDLKIALRKGDTSVVLLEYLRRYHVEVESLYHVPQDLWGYAERTIRGSSSTLSNHASGTAVDARAVKNGLGMVGTFTKAQEAALDRLLADFRGVLRHGKNYSGRKDPMHAEIVGTPAQVKALADAIRGGPVAPSPSPRPTTSAPQQEDDLRDDERKWLQALYMQVTGNDFDGWPTWDGGTNEKLTPVDYLRRANVETRQVHHNLASVHSKLDALAARVAAAAGQDDAPAPLVLSEVPTPELLAELGRRMTGAPKS
jgi:hypothetical protein